jgi:hypothetical protein
MNSRILLHRLLPCLALLLAAWQPASAQGNISPYSILGIGELSPEGGIRNIGMGGVGMATPAIPYSNTMNPALLPINAYTLLDVNYLGDFRLIETNTERQESASGNLLGVSLSFPVLRNRYSMAVGLRPMSQVNYNLRVREELPGTASYLSYNYNGSGGVSQAYWSHGVQLFKGFSMGLEINYNFGSVTHDSKSTVVDTRSLYTLALHEQTTFSNVTVAPGLAYSLELDSALFLSIGLKYDQALDLGVQFTRELQRQALSGAILASDTVRLAQGTVSLPQRFSAGIALYRPFRYTLGVDISLGEWSQYKSELREQGLADAFRLSVGGEWTPDVNSISSYFKRVTYRAGVRYERTPWMVNDVQINDIGISFGLSMPVGRGLSYLNWAFTAGQRGNLSDGLIQERYFRVGLGLSINDPQWFRRRRIN